MSLRLLGRAHTTLESQAIAGVPKVKLNIGRISEAKQKILNAAFQTAPQMTQEDKTITDKSIIIPSFATTSAIFTQHFMILKDLKKRIEGLKKAYYRQREEARAWELVDHILLILDSGVKYLDFPTTST